VINQGPQIQKFFHPAEVHSHHERRFVEPEMTTEAAPKGQLMYLGLAVLVLLSGLCTIFAAGDGGTSLAGACPGAMAGGDDAR
jgi:hypothetical protein